MPLQGTLIKKVSRIRSGISSPFQTPGFGAPPPNPFQAMAGAHASIPQPAQPIAQAQAAPGPDGTAGQSFTFTPDAGYLAALARDQFERQTQVNQLEAQAKAQKADTDESVRRIEQKVPDDRRQITAGANRQGLLYSGQHAKRLDDYQGSVLRAVADQRLALQRGDDARAEIRRALQEGASLEDAAQRAAAIERQIERDTAAAQANMLAPPDESSRDPAPARVATARSSLRRARAGLRARSRRTGIRR